MYRNISVKLACAIKNASNWGGIRPSCFYIAKLDIRVSACMDEISVIDISHIKTRDKIHFAMTQHIFFEFKNTLSTDSF
ncbi:Uncharacterised protein [Vibrio cholerae]|nr:Uncharacterised protein [Vibrio cholerae]